MLINCPECELQVSDKAINCPHCGYPLIKTSGREQKRSNKIKRLPNGFGQISFLKGKPLRNPYRAMVTVGHDQNTGRPIVRLLQPQSYFRTYNDAYEALVKYHKDPYSLDSTISVGDLYTEWSKQYFATLKSQSSIRTIEMAWRRCSKLSKMSVSDVRVYHIKDLINELDCSSNIKQRVKSTFNLLFDYAVERELITNNPARAFVLSKNIIDETPARSHMPFSNDEIDVLWKNIDVPYVDVLLIQCYGGWRPQELGLIKTENVNMADGVIVGGIKTESGKNRIVPIHPKIREIVKTKYEKAIENDSEYLIPCVDTRSSSKVLTYDKYRDRFMKIIETLGLNKDHKAHDGRMHFITMAKKYNVDEYAIKYIVGHSINDITEKVYTKRDIDWLKSEMNKIM